MFNKRQLVPFYSGFTDYLTVDDGSIGSFRSPCTGDCYTGVVLGEGLARGSTCMGDEKGNCDLKPGLIDIKELGGVDIDS